MTNTDTTLARRNGASTTPGGNGLAPTDRVAPLQLQTLAEVLTLGDVLARTGFFKDVNDAGRAVAKILYGAELGIGPMASMMGVHIIDGKLSPSATLMATLIKRSRRYNYRVTVFTDRECRITFTEYGEPCGEASFTIQEAQAAGVAGKQVWKAYPKAMLFSRAMGQGARAYCADVFGGAPVYAAEELDGPTAVEDTVIDGQAVDLQTGEIMGEAHEVPTEEPDPDAEYHASLQANRDAALGSALAAVGMDRSTLDRTLQGAGKRSWAERNVDEQLQLIRHYEAKAAAVQAPAEATA